MAKVKSKVKASNKDFSKNEVSEGKICAVLSYLLMGIIWYFADEKMKKNKFVNFHVKQGLVLLIFDVALWILVSIFGAIIGAMIAISTFGGTINPIAFSPLGFIGALVSFLAWAVTLVLLILGIINAANGNRKKLPLIGKFGEKFTF